MSKFKNIRPACSLIAIRSASQGLAADAWAWDAKRMPLAAVAMREAMVGVVVADDDGVSGSVVVCWEDSEGNKESVYVRLPQTHARPHR